MIFVKFVLLKIVSEVFDWPLFALLSFFLLVNIVVFMLFLMNDCLSLLIKADNTMPSRQTMTKINNRRQHTMLKPQNLARRTTTIAEN
jgi:hypothetical protein